LLGHVRGIRAVGGDEVPLVGVWATFGKGTVAVTGGAIAAAAMLSASLVPSLRRIEIN
jgi:Na+/proline symporter